MNPLKTLSTFLTVMPLFMQASTNNALNSEVRQIKIGLTMYLKRTHDLCSKTNEAYTSSSLNGDLIKQTLHATNMIEHDIQKMYRFLAKFSSTTQQEQTFNYKIKLAIKELETTNDALFNQLYSDSEQLLALQVASELQTNTAQHQNRFG